MQISSAKLGIFSLGALAVLGGTAGAWLHERADETLVASAARPATSAVTATGSAVTAVAARTDSRWELGTSRSYDMDFSARIDTGSEDPNSWFSVLGSATLKLTRVDATDPGNLYLRGELSGFSAVLENEEHSGLQIEAYVEKGLDKPFLIRLSESGRVLALGTHSEVGGVGYNILRSVISTLQFVEPQGKDPSWETWETEESDQTGICKARYRKLGGGGFEKTKLGYSYAASAGLAGPEAERLPTVQSVTQLVWQQGTLSSARLSESIAQPFGDQNTINTKTLITLQLVNSGKEAASAADKRGLTFLQLFQTKSQPVSAEGERQRRMELVAGASVRDLTTELGKLGDSPDNRDARWKLSERLTALLELDPTLTRSVVDALRSASSSADRDMVLDALGQADTPEARAALAGVARDRNAEPGLRDAVITELGLNERGSVESLEALQGVATDPSDVAVRSAATLALGSAANAGSRTAELAEPTSRAVRTLSDGYQRATSGKEQRLYLDALGNAGSEDGLAVIRGALSHPDAQVRATAVSALRRIPGVEADRLLISALRGDSAPRVRATAAAAFEERKLTEELVTALGEALRSDQVAEVRAEVVRILMPLGSQPAARTLLEWVARNDPEQSLRLLAQNAIKGGAVTG